LSGSLHIITSEYPPDVGGVAEFSGVLAEAVGREVHVWAGGHGGDEISDRCGHPVRVHRRFGRFHAGALRRVGRALAATPRPRRLLVQWVPHAFGMRALNLPFCLWLWARVRLRGDQIDLFVHEPFLSDVRSLRQRVVAAVHRLMVAVLLRSASKVFLSIEGWERALRPYAPRALSFRTLPLPSGIGHIDDAGAVQALRRQLGADEETKLVGHFGTCGGPMLPMLLSTLPPLIRSRPDLRVLLIGRDSELARATMAAALPGSEDRIRATGVIPARDVSLHLQACDVLVQPYPDGVSARRTSLIAALRSGAAIVTTSGHLTESFWNRNGAVEVVPVGDLQGIVRAVDQLLEDHDRRDGLRRMALQMYEERFSISKLRELIERP
jgi:glycosyltransferase involved in cell wall biosynthesis